MAVFVWSLSLEHDRANLPAASSNSDATDPGLDLILPLAACRPQYLLETVRRVYARVCVNIIPIPQQWYTESDLYNSSKKQNVRRGPKNHELRAQCNHKANMAVTWQGTMLLCTEQDGVWYPRTQVRRSPITQSWQGRQIRAYPKNVNLPVLGQGNLPLNRLQLLSSEERGRKRKKDIWNQQLCGPYPRAADSVTPYSLYGTQLLHHTKTHILFFLRQLSHSL